MKKKNSIDKVALNLKKKYGRKSEITNQILDKIYFKIVNFLDSPEITESFELWDLIFSDSLGLRYDKIGKELRNKYSLFSENANFDPKLALFALQTYYSLIVRLLVFNTLGYRISMNFVPADLIMQKRSFLDSYEYLERETNIRNLLSKDPYVWLLKSDYREFLEYLEIFDLNVLSEAIQPLLSEMELFHDNPSIESGDYLWELYKDLFPKKVRHALGEYYTPEWTCDLALENIGYVGNLDSRLLDPAAGSGAFLLAALRKISIYHGMDINHNLIKKIMTNIQGYDINPLAILSARANIIIALKNFVPFVENIDIPVFQRDSVIYPFAIENDLFGIFEQKYDYVIGNPPWVNWKSLPDTYRKQIIPVSEKYNLFEHKGMKARLGYAQDDLATIFMYVAIDKYLKDDGKLSFLLPKSLLKTYGGGQGFRRMRLGQDGIPFKVSEVIDFADLNLFGATGSTMLFSCEKGKETEFPVKYNIWTRKKRFRTRKAHLEEAKKCIKCLDFHGEPIKESNSVWITADLDMIGFIKSHLMPSNYRARAGVCTWASGIYWVDILKKTGDYTQIKNYTKSSRTIDRNVETEIEDGLLYPLVRGKDVRRWKSQSQLHILLPQSDDNLAKAMPENLFTDRYGRAYEYLKDFEKYLKARKGYKKFLKNQPFYAVYDIGPYTFSKYKACWKYLDRDMQSAVLTGNGKPIIPDLNVITIPCDSENEAHYLSSMLNSSFIRLIIHSFGLCTRITPGIMSYLPIPDFDQDDNYHMNLSELSKNAHSGQDKNIIEEIDDNINEIFSFSQKQRAKIPSNLSKYIG
ncbi:MAG: Eco57I restriction-modification methylase domain-containing protein [Candidatus Zixiibacteriota bacterium]